MSYKKGGIKPPILFILPFLPLSSVHTLSSRESIPIAQFLDH